MNDRITILFEGTITAETHLAVCRPNDNFWTKNHTEKTQRLPRLGSKSEDTQVCITGGTYRGPFRRCARDVIRRAVAKAKNDDKPFDITTHYMLTQGVDVTNETASEKASGTISQEQELRKQNPALSLFGRWGLTGHLGVGTSIPNENDVIFMDGKGVRTNDYIRSPEQVEFLKPEEKLRLVKMIEDESSSAKDNKEIDAEMKGLKKEIRTPGISEEKILSIREQIKELEIQKDNNKTNKSGAKESIQRPLDGYESIKHGTLMTHHMSIENGNNAEIGLFLLSLREFARNPRIGGHHGQEAGKISASWGVTTWPADTDAPIHLGTVNLSSKGFSITDECQDKVLSNAMSEFTELLKNPEENNLDFERFLIIENKKEATEAV